MNPAVDLVAFMTRTYSTRQQPIEVTFTINSNAPTLVLKLHVYVRATKEDFLWGWVEGPPSAGRTVDAPLELSLDLIASL